MSVSKNNLLEINISVSELTASFSLFPVPFHLFHILPCQVFTCKASISFDVAIIN